MDKSWFKKLIAVVKENNWDYKKFIRKHYVLCSVCVWFITLIFSLVYMCQSIGIFVVVVERFNVVHHWIMPMVYFLIVIPVFTSPLITIALMLVINNYIDRIKYRDMNELSKLWMKARKQFPDDDSGEL